MEFMTNPPPTLPVDWEHPFMKSVLDVLEKRGTLDVVVDLLLAAEQKHELYVLGDPFASAVDGMYSLRVNGAAPTAIDVMTRIKAGQDLGPYIQRSTLSEEEWHAQVLFPFLDQAPIILMGGDFSNDYCIISRGPLLATFTWRWWGGVLATWANKRLPAQPHTWDYMDFYMEHGPPLFPKYGDWAKVVRRAINEATNKVHLSLP
jgi:hypothetical protein